MDPGGLWVPLETLVAKVRGLANDIEQPKAPARSASKNYILGIDEFYTDVGVRAVEPMSSTFLSFTSTATVGKENDHEKRLS